MKKIFLMFCMISFSAFGQLKLEQSNDMISGELKDPKETMSFTIDYAHPEIVISFFLPNSKEITWMVSELEISLSSWSSNTNTTATMEKKDQRLFKKLLYLLQIELNSVREIENQLLSLPIHYLFKAVELMSLYAVDSNIEIIIPRVSTRSIAHICNLVGTSRYAFWDAYGVAKYKLFTVGGHGVCKGHCGIGCPTVMPGGGFVYNYTQDCFNHDACHTEEGSQLGECRDEYIAAIDDFFSIITCP